MSQNICYIPVSIGELYDKYTILQIKQNKITCMEKLKSVNNELDYLKKIIHNYNLDNDLVNELKTINETLWTIEANIRKKENIKSFDDEFINLARNVYITNDKRSKLKHKINSILKSEINDIKDYSKY